MVHNVISSLVPRSTPETYGYEMLIKRANLLSNAQAEAILNFFEAYTDIYPIEEWSFNASDEKRVEKGIQFWKSRINIEDDK